jgi:mRNA interferase RelE/StbE
MWRVEINEVAEKAPLKLDKPVRERIFAFLHGRVEPSQDATALAEPLKGEFHGLWRFRIGDYRVVCDIQKTIQVVAVVQVGHRGDIYRKSGR